MYRASPHSVISHTSAHPKPMSAVHSNICNIAYLVTVRVHTHLLKSFNPVEAVPMQHNAKCICTLRCCPVDAFMPKPLQPNQLETATFMLKQVPLCTLHLRFCRRNTARRQTCGVPAWWLTCCYVLVYLGRGIGPSPHQISMSQWAMAKASTERCIH